MATRLEHINVTVCDLERTSAWMEQIFGWSVRWRGASIYDGESLHIGSDESYIALYRPKVAPQKALQSSYETRSALNHLAVVVDDLDDIEEKVLAAGFKPVSHADYEPGRRFYFKDEDGLEVEVVQY